MSLLVTAWPSAAELAFSNMKKIRLTRGLETIVDDDDFRALSVLKWYAQWNVDTRSFYACRHVGTTKEGKRPVERMSRVVVSAPTGMDVDHVNHNTLDNRKSNLRVVTRSQNSMNKSGPRADSHMGFRGVGKNKNRFRARIGVGGGASKNLRTFRTAKEAYAAYVRANAELYGEFGGHL